MLLKDLGTDSRTHQQPPSLAEGLGCGYGELVRVCSSAIGARGAEANVGSAEH